MPLVPLGKSRDPQDNVEFGRQGVLRTVDGSSDGPGLRYLQGVRCPRLNNSLSGVLNQRDLRQREELNLALAH